MHVYFIFIITFFLWLSEVARARNANMRFDERIDFPEKYTFSLYKMCVSVFECVSLSIYRRNFKKKKKGKKENETK